MPSLKRSLDLGFKQRLGAAVLVALTHALASSGCSKGEVVTGDPGRGGTGPGSGGTTGSAGSSSPGTGGSSSPGSAGSTTPGTAGNSSPGTGGSVSSGTAGSTTCPGSTGAGGATTNTDPATFAYLFNTGVEGWALSDYADTSRANLADPARAVSPAPTLAQDASIGNPDAGSLKVTAHFTDWKQYADAIINVSPTKMLTDRVLRARVRLTSGCFGGGAQIHAGTGSSYKFAAGTWTTLVAGQWTELALDLDAAHAADSTFDPSMVVQIGVKFDSGGDGVSSAFGGPIDAVFQIDTVSDGVVGGALPPAVNYTFDSDAQGFALNTYDSSSPKNLAGPNSPTTPTLVWDSSMGMPSPGSLKLSVTYSDFKQYVDASLNVSSLDLTGKTLHAFVMLDSGGFDGGVQLHAGSGSSYTFASSTYTSFEATYLTWMEVTLDLTAAQSSVSGFAANDIRQIGVQFSTGDPYEGGAYVSPVDVVFQIDSITAQ
jgi:hypothetical protein